MNFTIKLDKTRIYINEKYITDGKVLISKDAIRAMPRPPQNLLSLITGKIPGSYITGKYNTHCPEFNDFIEPAIKDANSLVDYIAFETIVPIGNVLAIRLTTKTFPIYIDSKYYGILNLGDTVKARDSKSPLVVYKNSELVGIVMPMRASHSLDKYEFQEQTATDETELGMTQ